jgi:transposase
MNSLLITSIVYSQHAYKNKNIADFCRLFSLSRTTYYEWQMRFKKFGYLGLKDKERSKHKMPNQIKPEYKTIIYNYITDYPTHGPRRISNELKAQGVIISETGVYNVLKRKGLNRLLARIFYVQMFMLF